MRRGDLVIVDFRFVDPSVGVRPCLIVQNDRDNARMTNLIVVQVTTNLSRAGVDTQALIDAAHPDWNASGLHRPSVVNCSNIITIHKQRVLKVVGALSPSTMTQIDQCLKAALGIP